MEKICIKAKGSSHELSFPERIDDTVCRSSVSIVGYGEEGDRLYKISDRVCSNEISIPNRLYDCIIEKQKYLICDVVFIEKIENDHKFMVDSTLKFLPE
jgi:hypothetical protein